MNGDGKALSVIWVDNLHYNTELNEAATQCRHFSKGRLCPPHILGFIAGNADLSGLPPL